MKKYRWLLLLVCCCCYSTTWAQTQAVEQLLLDVEKLSQFKKILQDMKTGYTVVMKGYNTVKDISEGDFNLHKTFLDGLLQISPAVRKYQKVAAIISFQLSIVKEYKAAFNRFKNGDSFNPDELLYIIRVYNNLLDKSLKNIQDLTMILTANQLRMSDEGRLAAIDHLYTDMQDKVSFLRSFDNATSVLALQRSKELVAVKTVQEFYNH